MREGGGGVRLKGRWSTSTVTIWIMADGGSSHSTSSGRGVRTANAQRHDV